MMRWCLLVAMATGLLSGCALFNRGGGFGVSGGTAQERAMVHGGINNAQAALRAAGFDVDKPGHTVRLVIRPTLDVKTLPGGQRQGVMEWAAGNRWVYARADARQIIFARPLAGNTADHEARHVLLEANGYVTESRKHDRRAFPLGGNVH